MSLKIKNAIINKKQISIDKYIKLKKKNPNSKFLKCTIKDEDGFDLEFVESKYGKVRSHFRRKSNKVGKTNLMTDWHSSWENKFSEIKEKIYKHPNMIKKNRRADVDLNKTNIIEFQHSCIEKEEVDNRKNDWKLINKEIIWVIDGSDTIEVTELKNSERVFLEFKSDPWKYESFLDFDNIYIDINNEIYKVNPKFVKSKMIDVQQPVTKDFFIKALKENKEIFKEKKITQTNIYVKQQGAGNGKTYGIVQLINNNNFIHYDTFVYLTKQHSAVHVINNEIEDQLKKGYLDDIEIINKEKKNKKYIVHFINKKLKKERKIIIGTFDSFVWALGNQKIKAVNKFVAMAQSIIDEELNCSRSGTVKYADGIKLNKKLLLIGDEMQDLSEEYIKAVIKITRDRYVDFYGVGDLLQSISIKKNSFRFLYKNELPNDTIKIIKYKETNICRRFGNKKLVDFVNSIVPFSDKYSLPKIQSFNEYINNNSLTIFNGKRIYSSASHEEIYTEVKKILKYYIKEVDNNNYKPNDFLIVTPFSNKNPLVDALNTEIRDFWMKKYNDNNYIKYSVFHKSESGTSIDLTESDNATRIVSIHSSKGDGRPIVFVIGLSENGLKKFSNEADNLIYDSLLHVALTRMKKKLYVRIEENNDNIHKRIQNYLCESGDKQNIVPYLKISKSIKLESLIQNNQKQSKNYKIFNENIIKFTKYYNFPLNEESNNKLIDMKHHCVRYIIFYVLWIIKIMNEKSINIEEKISSQQIFQIWNKMIDKDINYIENTRNYYQKLYDKKYIKTNLPMLIYSNKEGDYKKYSFFIKKKINLIIKKIKKYIKKDKNIELKVIDSIIMHHLMQLSDQGKFSDLPVSDLYDIIDLYKKAKPDEKDLYLQSHYNKINMIYKLYDKLNTDYKNLKWLLDHFVYFNGKSSDFEIYKKFNLLAFNEDTVLICYIKPQFSQLNYNEIILNSIFDTFLIKNVMKKDKDGDSKNYKKFNGKKILTCVLSFDLDYPFIINWTNIKKGNDLIKKNNDFIKNIIRDDIFSHFEMKNHNIYLFYKYYLNKFKKKNNNPINLITKVIDKYNKIKEGDIHTKFPNYIDELFFEIKSSLRKKKKEKQLEILNKYKDKVFFMDEALYLLKESISNYFN